MSRECEVIHLGFHNSIRLITSIITTKSTIWLMHGPCGSVHVLTKVLTKHLVGECKYSRKCDNTLRLIFTDHS